MTTPETNEQAYHRLMHAMQSGVAAKMNYDGGPATGETSPKSLRVGVNSAMVEFSALVALLVAKGIITHDEFTQSLREYAANEVEMYETWLNHHLGTAGPNGPRVTLR